MNLVWITCGAAVVTVVVAVAGGYLVRGTTAVPAAAWAALAAAMLAGEAAATAAGWLVEPASQSAMRLVVAALAVCPTMSLLGAKRPQHGVWQFIVATLAFVLALPAVTSTLVRPGGLPDVHLLERFFLPILVILGWMNFAATRHAAAAVLVAAGQLSLMWIFLPGVEQGQPLSAGADAAAATVVASGAVLAVVQSAWWPAGMASTTGIAGTTGMTGTAGAGSLAAIIDRPVLAMRETLGAAWTLRIAERFNAVAAERGWPCRLRFTGLVVDSQAAGGLWEREAIRCVRSLLRRFASPGWLHRHGGLDTEA